MAILINQIKTLSQQGAFRRTIGYYLVFVNLGLDMALLGTTLPHLAEQTGTTLGQMAYIFLTGSIGFMLGSTFGGRIFDHIAGHPVLGGAQIVAATCLALVPVFPQFWVLILVLVVKGFMQGTINNGSNILLVWTHQSKVGPYMNGLHFFFGLGAFLSPFLVAQAFSAGIGYRWVFWILAVFSMMVGLGMLLMPGSPRPVHSEERSQVPVPASSMNGRFYIILAALFLLFYVGSEVSYGNWIYTYAFKLGLLDEIRSAYLVSAFWFSFTASRLISIFLATRLSARLMISITLAGSLVFIVLAISIPGSIMALWAATIGVGFCMGPIYPTAVTLAGQSIKLSGRNAGVIFLGDSLGGMLLPWLAGQMIDGVGPRALVFLVLGSLVGNTFSFLGMLRTRPQHVTQPALLTE